MSSIRRRARKSDVDKQLSMWTKRRILSWSLFGAAIVIIVQHWIAHMGYKPIPLSMGWQDLLIGYPTGLLLAIAGGIALDPNPKL